MTRNTRAAKFKTTSRKPSLILKRALALLGPTGKHWGKGMDHQRVKVQGREVEKWCARGAICAITGYTHTGALDYLADTSRHGTITEQNDNARAFPSIQKWFRKAIARAVKDGR